MTPKEDQLIDQVHKLLRGLNRTFEDPAVPDFDKELLKNYLKEWFK